MPVGRFYRGRERDFPYKTCSCVEDPTSKGLVACLLGGACAMHRLFNIGWLTERSCCCLEIRVQVIVNYDKATDAGQTAASEGGQGSGRSVSAGGLPTVPEGSKEGHNGDMKWIQVSNMLCLGALAHDPAHSLRLWCTLSDGNYIHR